MTDDKGYLNGQQFERCQQEGMMAYVPANRASNNQGNSQHFQRDAFRYDAATDSWICPKGATLKRKQTNKGNVVYMARASDCQTCPLKPDCTSAAQRFISRHEHEAAFERMAQRIQARPEMALAVTAYNLKLAIDIPGTGKLLALLD